MVTLHQQVDQKVFLFHIYIRHALKLYGNRYRRINMNYIKFSELNIYILSIDICRIIKLLWVKGVLLSGSKVKTKVIYIWIYSLPCKCSHYILILKFILIDPDFLIVVRKRHRLKEDLLIQVVYCSPPPRGGGLLSV